MPHLEAYSVRALALPITAVTVLLLLSPAIAEPTPAVGLLYKHRLDGTTNGWLTSGGATVTAESRWGGLSVNALPGQLARSPSLPEGTREVVLLARIASTASQAEILAMNEAGSPILTLRYQENHLCVGTACSPQEMGLGNVYIALRVAPDGWSAGVRGEQFVGGPEDLGDLDHLAIHSDLAIADLRAYGNGGFVDEPFRDGLGGFVPIIDLATALDGSIFAPAYETTSAGLLVRAHGVHPRTLFATPAPAGSWLFESDLYSLGTTGGYAVVAGLGATGETLWRIGIHGGPFNVGPNPWTITLREGNTVRTVGSIPIVPGQNEWHGWVAAHADEATGTITMRFNTTPLPPISVESLESTAFVAFGDADAIPILSPEFMGDAGNAVVRHRNALVARVGDGFEV